MPELTTDDLPPAVLAKFADDEAAQAAIDAAVAAARRYCGWHVTPVREDDEIVVDGPGSPLLSLPTRRLTNVVELVEDGTAVDVDSVEWSTLGLLRKASGCYWSRRYGGITVTVTHGFDDAVDFVAAVLSYVDRASVAVTSAVGRLKAVGPFQYETETLSSASAFTVAEQALLDQYRILVSP